MARVTPLVAAPALGRGLLLLAASPDLGSGVTYLLPPLTSGVGCSSWPPPLTSGVGALLSVVVPGLGLRSVGYLLSAAPPELGRGVAPLGRSCAVAVWYSQPLPLTSTVG